MIKIITVVGARPQFIKASVISRAIRNSYSDKINEKIIHTGQHYDENMSEIFFKELDIPTPDFKLNVGSGEHGYQTSEMLNGIEKILLLENPNYVLVYGDTNSTLAGALAASKLGIPLIHIEAGLRSFNKSMPEEINRILCDHVSTLLFTPTLKGIENLKKEGFNLNNIRPFHIDNPGIFHCGDIMFDSALYFSSIAEEKSTILLENSLTDNEYILVTLHRNTNTDNVTNLKSIFSALDYISIKHNLKIIIPIHPRTQKKWHEMDDVSLKDRISRNNLIIFLPPASYNDFINLEKHAKMILTDSGGVQKEAYFFKKKLLIIRDETEWTELLDHGMAVLCGTDTNLIIKGFEHLLKKDFLEYPQIYGDGNAADLILTQILSIDK